eukprot:TRINITY_DN731_c0_g2_i2.p1 TRINITY_DN731_c0_g2~~TRINITY_DN731_c0_g2_i2.p1  ORF type:complete len:444 (-),score=126.88 TRINITY_DN731_c0_g2_i2:546-1877(-)
MHHQPILNIGTSGSVSHGKSTLVFKMTGIRTGKSFIEKKRNMTVNLGYANCKVFKCNDMLCEEPGCFASGDSQTREEEMSCRQCGGNMRLETHFSFVDVPGHESFMSTMINGSSVMDASVFVVAADQPCPQRQTQEHLNALEMSGLQEMFVMHNKLDLISPAKAESHFTNELQPFLKSKHISRKAPVVPSALSVSDANVDVLLQWISNLKVPDRKLDQTPKMHIIRSFDVNRPGMRPEDLVGGVLGGSLSSGVLRVGQKIMILPGITKRNENGQIVAVRPIKSIVRSLKSDETILDQAIPGGLIGVGTSLDPSLCIGDNLVGQTMVAADGETPTVYTSLICKCEFIDRIFNDDDEDQSDHDEQAKNQMCLRKRDRVSVHTNAAVVFAMVQRVASTVNIVELTLASAACLDKGSRVTIAKKIEGKSRVIGFAEVMGGTLCDVIV